MASSKVRPTPPPRGPALVRPAVGALLLTLSGTACGDDGTSDTGNDSQAPMIGSEGPMPNPTTDSAETVAPMIPPTTTTGDATTGDTDIGPMPNPTTESADSTGTGTGTDTGTDTDGSTTAIPPMPPPTSGALPGDEPE